MATGCTIYFNDSAKFKQLLDSGFLKFQVAFKETEPVCEGGYGWFTFEFEGVEFRSFDLWQEDGPEKFFSLPLVFMDPVTNQQKINYEKMAHDISALAGCYVSVDHYEYAYGESDFDEYHYYRNGVQVTEADEPSRSSFQNTEKDIGDDLFFVLHNELIELVLDINLA